MKSVVVLKTRLDPHLHKSTAVDFTSSAVHRHSFADTENRTVAGDTDDKLLRSRASTPSFPRPAAVSALLQRPGGSTPASENPRSLVPDEYGHAKKKLKKAVQEHYR
jgi:hypothetical protein